MKLYAENTRRWAGRQLEKLPHWSSTGRKINIQVLGRSTIKGTGTGNILLSVFAFVDHCYLQ